MDNKIEESFKPRTWLLIVLILIGIVILVVLLNKIVEDNKNKPSFLDNFNDVNDNFDDNFDDEFNKVSDEINKMQEEQKVSSFNSKFEMMAGTKKGFFVIGLIDDIITSNKTKKDHIITVTFNEVSTQDEETIRGFKSSIDNSKDYEVILEYDENGFVNEVVLR